uniref:SCP domain-containing protein n=1 Tax=Mesocestoides corti TaxID=53468 RepID=A0A5K3FIV9_MESCO
MHIIVLLLALIGHVLGIVPTQEESEQIIEKFTRVREKVSPAASNMNHLTYSKEMEKRAKSWLSYCLYQLPSPSRHPEFATTGMLLQSTFKLNQGFRGVDVFAKESKNYNYVDNSCKGSCSRYKQIVWAASTEVGCAKAKCHDRKSSRPIYYMACVFNNADNYLEERPYEKGVSCSQCPQGVACLRNQCAAKMGQNTTASFAVL